MTGNARTTAHQFDAGALVDIDVPADLLQESGREQSGHRAADNDCPSSHLPTSSVVYDVHPLEHHGLEVGVRRVIASGSEAIQGSAQDSGLLRRGRSSQ